MRAVVQHPAGYDPSSPLLLFEKIYGEVAITFTENRTLGIRNEYSFRSHVPTAHALAYLRFADPVAETVARFTTGPGGLTPGWAGFAPAGQHSKFHGVIASSNPNRPAEPGRTDFPIPEADQRAWDSARRPKPSRLAFRRRLQKIVAKKLSANWSPEQIAGWLKQRYPGNPEMQISHETIYRSLFVQARGVRKKELVGHLRTRLVIRRSQ